MQSTRSDKRNQASSAGVDDPGRAARHASPPRPAQHAGLDLGGLLRGAARIAGMPADAAERFATTRVVQSGPVSVAVATLLPDDAGPVVLNAVFERPQRLTEEQWWTTLLMLNVHSLMMTPSAFGLDTLGRTVLVMHLPEDQRSAPMLAAVLKGMVTTCMTLLAEPPPLPPELAKAEGGA